jgi:CheY-like chemotaxis protein
LPAYDAEAQPQEKVHRVAHLSTAGRTTDGKPPAPLREGLRELGYVEGQNVIFEARFAEGKVERLPETLRRVFEPFFTTKDTGKGTGLGLSMVFGFMKQSGGHVQIYSELGRGATVRLYLPRAGRESAAERPAVGAPVALPRGTETVLVVEDNDKLRRVLVRQLMELGYGVREATKGAEALELLRSDEAYDLLLTDIVMPGGMNGWELARIASELRPSLNVLFTSGFPEVALSEQGLPEGVLLVSKPYRKQDLAEKVRAALAA